MLELVDALSDRLLRSFGARSLVIPTSAGSVHAYDATGPGERTFVLLHGMGTTATSYTGIFLGLRPHARRVVLVDLPGHGRSVLGESFLSVAALGDGIREALDGILWEEERFVLFGTSLGGAAALRYALDRPKRIAKLILVSPGGAPLSEEDFLALRRRFDVRTAEDARRFFSLLMHDPPLYFRLFEKGLVSQLGRPFIQRFLAEVSPDDFFKKEELASLRVPTLVIWGKRDRILPRSSLAFYRDALPEGTVFEEPDALGHSPHVEQPGFLMKRLLA
ncbi:MAG: alpha/beta hydrolase [Myxococcales bacterium]|nr:alpha/beta hydrolase [Myxococcales bacterium]